MRPPLADYRIGGEPLPPLRDTTAPFSKWITVDSFDTAAVCEKSLVANTMAVLDRGRRIGAAGDEGPFRRILLRRAKPRCPLRRSGRRRRSVVSPDGRSFDLSDAIIIADYIFEPLRSETLLVQLYETNRRISFGREGRQAVARHREVRDQGAFLGCFMIGENTDGDARGAHDLDYYVARDAVVGVHQQEIAATAGA